MDTVTVIRNAQITIPKQVRDALGITEGSKVAVRVEGDRIVIQKVDEDVWSDCRDFLPKDFEKIMSKVRADFRSRFRRLGLIP